MRLYHLSELWLKVNRREIMAAVSKERRSRVCRVLEEPWNRCLELSNELCERCNSRELLLLLWTHESRIVVTSLNNVPDSRELEEECFSRVSDTHNCS